jgi:hypothetical protein
MASEDPRALAYILVTPGDGPSGEAQAERIQAHAATAGWHVVNELRTHRFPELTELARRLDTENIRRMVLTREVLYALETGFGDAWHGVRTRLEAHGVAIIAI